MPASFDEVRTALAAQWARLIEGFGAASPDAASRIPGWTVADLERHVSQTGESLARLASGPSAQGPVTGLREWAAALPGMGGQIADRVLTEPGSPLGTMMPSALQALATANPNRPVRQLTGIHLLSDAALFRLVEAVVHGLDLPEPVEPDRRARQIVVRTLAHLLGALAPGRSVELRIPPDAAVQLLEGPRHTRGTPPGVVETDPISFLQLATGRTTWEQASADGRLRASGQRTDLSVYLPLLQ